MTFTDDICSMYVMSIVEVAKLAKVSNATVSRVINCRDTVKPDTVERVRKAMTKMGYIPKPLLSRPGPRLGGRQDGNYLKGGRTGIVALVMCMKPSFLGHSPVLTSAVHGVEEALTQRGLSMVQIYVQPGGPVSPILSKNGVDGSLVIHAMPDNVEAVLDRYGRVTLMSEATSHSDHVFCDNEAIGNLALNYLKERGHRHAAFLSLHKEHAASIVRREAFCKAAQKSQIEADLFEHPNKWGYDLLSKPQVMESMCETTVEEMLKMPNKPTGIFVASDAFAAILYPVLKRLGIKPGKDVDIISCNNEAMLLAGLSPCPATIDIKAEYIGRRAVEQLCWRIQNPDDPTVIEIKIRPELVVRG